jgi:hypothetical protein
MNAFNRLNRSAFLLTALALAACATNTPPPAPIVSLESRSCAEAPDLTTATPLSLGPPGVTPVPVTLTLSGDAACLQTPENLRSAYVVLQLPEAAEPYMLTVTSTPQGSTLLSPRLLLLDGQGAVLRDRRRETFLSRGTSLYTNLRAFPSDRYLVVASDPGSVGQQISQISGETKTTTVPIGVGIMMIHSGSESTHSSIYSHNGTVTVVARPLPKGS